MTMAMMMIVRAVMRAMIEPISYFSLVYLYSNECFCGNLFLENFRLMLVLDSDNFE